MNNFKKLLLISATLLLGINEVWPVKASPTEEGAELGTQASKKTPTKPQKESSKKVRASKKKDSSPTYSIKSSEDLRYEDNDISEYIDSFLQQNRTFRRFSDFTYVLSSTQERLSPILDQEDGNDYLVAIAPAIDTEGTENESYGISSTQGGFFLDKSLRRKSVNGKILEGLIQFINSPNSNIDPDNPRNALKKKSQELNKNKSRLEIIDNVLNRGENNLEKIQEEIDKELFRIQHVETDVFEELSLYISNPGDIHVKILFPYNISESHWLTGEIRLHRKGSQYECELYAHNPYGGGTMEGSTFGELEKIIRKRIGECEPNALVTSVRPLQSPYGRRQAEGDVISCGVIVADDLIKRIIGAPIGNVVYPVSALSLRVSQLKCVKESKLNLGFVARNQARIAYVGKEEKSKSQSKGKGPSQDPLPKKSQVSTAKTSSQEEVKKTYTFSPTTIKICPKNLEELRVQQRKDCTVRDGCAYDSCYGRNMIFYVHNKLTKWRKAALERVQKFSDEIEQFTLQNFVVASLKLKAIDLSLSQRLNLPYVFFSGNPGEIERNISLKEVEANNKNLPPSLPKSIQEKIKTLLKENNIAFIANKYFHVEAPPFFATPLEESLFVFRSNEESSVLNFRKFIYSHFITEEEWNEILTANNPFLRFNPIIKNLVTYSDGCSSYLSSKEDSDSSKKQQTKKKQHSAEKEDPAVRAYNFILELALAENYIAQEKEDLIQAVFNERPTDLFDAGKHDKGKSSGDRKLGMSFCFHQSEQSFLLYLLEKSTPEILSDFQSRVANFIIEHVNDNFNTYSRFLKRDTGESSPTGGAASSTNLDPEDFKSANSQPKPDSLSITTVGVGENPMSDEEIIEDLDEFTDITDSCLQPKSEPSVDGTISSATGPKEVIFKVNTNFDINLDIISPRHICKFCRGTFYLCQDKISLFLSTFLTKEGITLDNKKPLHQKISDLQTDSLIEALLKLKLNKIKVNIFATSYKDVDNADLLGILK